MSDNKIKSISGRKIKHHFDVIEDYTQDTVGCPDFCIGCGGCSHVVKKYAVECYSRSIKEVNFYCNTCYNKKKTSFFGYLLCSDNYDADIVIVYDFNKCVECKETTFDTHVNYDYYTEYVCTTCATDKKITSETLYRCNSFHCVICNTDFKIEMKDKVILLCENISRMNKFLRHQMKVRTDGETSTEIIEQDIL